MQKKFYHPWHDIPRGSEAPDIVNAIIEIPQGTKAKYEVDKETGMLRLDRILFSALHYPANYGFIPQSLCGDGDPLDILVLCAVPLQHLCVARAKVIGCMRMLDRGAPDDKIIAVAGDDVSVKHYNSLSELPPNFMLEMQRFFEDYTKLEGKSVTVDTFTDAAKAKEIILENFEAYTAMVNNV